MKQLRHHLDVETDFLWITSPVVALLAKDRF